MANLPRNVESLTIVLTLIEFSIFIKNDNENFLLSLYPYDCYHKFNLIFGCPNVTAPDKILLSEDVTTAFRVIDNIAYS